MATNTTHNAGGLYHKLVAAAKADPKKAGILTILVIALTVLVGKRLADHRGPALALGAMSEEGIAGAVSSGGPSGSGNSRDALGAFEAWRLEPIRPVGRNLFAVQLDQFPQDGIRTGVPRIEGNGFWDQVAKSMSNQADAKTKRQTFVENLQSEAAKLRLQSTVMGAQPKALINGDLVREGDVVASFRVLRIEARRIIVEREGIKLEILMN